MNRFKAHIRKSGGAEIIRFLGVILGIGLIAFAVSCSTPDDIPSPTAVPIAVDNPGPSESLYPKTDEVRVEGTRLFVSGIVRHSISFFSPIQTCKFILISDGEDEVYGLVKYPRNLSQHVGKHVDLIVEVITHSEIFCIEGIPVNVVGYQSYQVEENLIRDN